MQRRFKCDPKWITARYSARCAEPNTALARRRVLQCVAAAGLRSVALSTAFSLAAVIWRGRPARGSVRSPATPASR